MLTTKEEARQKWCPMVRTARVENTRDDVTGENAVVAGCNTDYLGSERVPSDCRCVASDCAMWRWGEWKRDGVENVPLPSGHTYTRDRKIPLRGYCGLAGRPEVA